MTNEATLQLINVFAYTKHAINDLHKEANSYLIFDEGWYRVYKKDDKTVTLFSDFNFETSEWFWSSECGKICEVSDETQLAFEVLKFLNS